MSKLDDTFTGIVTVEAKENTDCYVDGSCVAVVDTQKAKQRIKTLILELMDNCEDYIGDDRGDEMRIFDGAMFRERIENL